MALVETSKIKDAALDWAVAQAQGYAVYIKHHKILGTRIYFQASGLQFSPSELWMHGGEIIECENISVRKLWDSGQPRPSSSIDAWRADLDFKDGVMTLGKLSQYGETPLIAAMRCYVASKLGDEIEIPDELVA